MPPCMHTYHIYTRAKKAPLLSSSPGPYLAGKGTSSSEDTPPLSTSAPSGRTLLMLGPETTSLKVDVVHILTHKSRLHKICSTLKSVTQDVQERPFLLRDYWELHKETMSKPTSGMRSPTQSKSNQSKIFRCKAIAH